MARWETSNNGTQSFVCLSNHVLGVLGKSWFGGQPTCEILDRIYPVHSSISNFVSCAEWFLFQDNTEWFAFQGIWLGFAVMKPLCWGRGFLKMCPSRTYVISRRLLRVASSFLLRPEDHSQTELRDFWENTAFWCSRAFFGLIWTLSVDNDTILWITQIIL